MCVYVCVCVSLSLPLSRVSVCVLVGERERVCGRMQECSCEYCQESVCACKLGDIKGASSPGFHNVPRII